ncbi:deoxynucleoside triphosphate triphosphohydrolase SAMHD1-like [Hoplias malabaricus]|uniref:deoxynucleoside triphosphate triphosphohydrolase SAMHD1-like n=1 Tax=Hoplias malabaricus TaxID=27720 RepID=UPI003463769F
MAEKESRTGTSSEQSRPKKIFNDPVHGHIEMHPLLVKIIDTPEFQRLRNLKQLGAGYFVFPGASHNRFEHSIGVSHLAGKLVQSLKDHQSDLELTEEHVLCAQIAGLCHDLGHGPFSHLFETFMKMCKIEWKHEKQSIAIFRDLIKNNGLKEEMEKTFKLDITLIEEMIYPEDKRKRNPKFYYLYEIVSNETTGIDVDKMDYFSRDCHHLGMKSDFSHERYMMFARVLKNENGEMHICMRDKEALNMYKLFNIRTLLHHSAYQHRVVKAIEIMMVDALIAANTNGRFSNAHTKLKEYLKLTDYILQDIQNSSSNDENIKKAQNIIERITNRDLYKFIGDEIFEKETLQHLKAPEDYQTKLATWLKRLKNEEIMNQKDEFQAVPIEFNYGKKEKNPLQFLQFYKKDEPDKAFSLDREKVSYLLPSKFAEMKVMLFYKGKDINIEKTAKEHCANFWEVLKEKEAYEPAKKKKRTN